MGSKHQNCNKGLWFLLGHGNGAGGERRPLQCHWFEMKKNSLLRHTEFITSWKWNIEIWPAKEKLVRGRHAPQMSSQLKTNFFALPIHEICSNFCFLTFALRGHFFFGILEIFLSTSGRHKVALDGRLPYGRFTS